jgi:hypothetical protein
MDYLDSKDPIRFGGGWNLYGYCDNAAEGMAFNGALSE